MTTPADDGSAARRAAYQAERAREIAAFEATMLRAKRLGVASLILAQPKPRPEPAKPDIAAALATAARLTDQVNFARAAAQASAEAKPARSNNDLIAAALKLSLDQRVPLSKSQLKHCKQFGLTPRQLQLALLGEQCLCISLSTSLRVAALSAGLANEPENALLKAVVSERDADVERQRRLA